MLCNRGALKSPHLLFNILETASAFCTIIKTSHYHTFVFSKALTQDDADKDFFATFYFKNIQSWKTTEAFCRNPISEISSKLQVSVIFFLMDFKF